MNFQSAHSCVTSTQMKEQTTIGMPEFPVLLAIISPCPLKGTHSSDFYHHRLILPWFWTLYTWNHVSVSFVSDFFCLMLCLYIHILVVAMCIYGYVYSIIFYFPLLHHRKCSMYQNLHNHYFNYCIILQGISIPYLFQPFPYLEYL